MVADYEFIRLSNEVVLICWHRTPTSVKVEQQFVDELRRLLDTATMPQYVISDLRKGRIVTVRTLSQLGQLAGHANLGGSTAFSHDPLTNIFVETFKRLSGKYKSRNETFDTPEEALAFMESLKSGLTDNINWDKVLRTPSAP